MGQKPLPEVPQRQQTNNPLHGITLKQIVTELVEKLGWKEMNRRVRVNCFYSNPSIKSSLTFLRKTNWARLEVEQMYMDQVCSLNNINDSNAKGDYDDTTAEDYEKYQQMYNREPDMYITKNIQLTDDRYLRMFDMKDIGVKNGYYPYLITQMDICH